MYDAAFRHVFLAYKFTGKERDSESGLDNFGARYNSSAMGRFTSPDPLLGSASISNPQTWNRYSYGLNNPLRNTDPFGLWNWNQSAGGDMSDEDLQSIADDKHNKRHKWAQNALNFRDQFRSALDSADEAAGSDALSEAQQSQVQESVNAYGSENDNNGVLVGQGGTGTGSGAGTLLNDNGTISVNFKIGLKGKEFAASLAHEGRHVADAQAFAALPIPAASWDLSHYERESRAYQVSSYAAQALGISPYLKGTGDMPGIQIWNKGWAEADRDTLRSRGIQNLIQKYYDFSPSNQGATYSQEYHPKP